MPDKLLSGEMKVMLLESDRVKLGGDGGDAKDGESKGAGDEEGGDGIADSERKRQKHSDSMKKKCPECPISFVFQVSH